MAKIRTKGSKISAVVGTADVDLAQLISFEHTGAESETYDATTLDTEGAGKEYEPTGYSEGGEVSGELFYDPAAASHQIITDLLVAPDLADFSLTFMTSSPTEMEFTAAGVGFDVSVDMADGLKGSFKMKLTGLLDYP